MFLACRIVSQHVLLHSKQQSYYFKMKFIWRLMGDHSFSHTWSYFITLVIKMSCQVLSFLKVSAHWPWWTLPLALAAEIARRFTLPLPRDTLWKPDMLVFLDLTLTTASELLFYCCYFKHSKQIKKSYCHMVVYELHCCWSFLQFYCFHKYIWPYGSGQLYTFMYFCRCTDMHTIVCIMAVH